MEDDESQDARSIEEIRRRCERYYFDDKMGPISAILEATFLIGLPEHLTAEQKKSLRLTLYPKLIARFAQRVNQPVTLGQHHVTIPYEATFQDAKYFSTRHPASESLKAAAMKKIRDELNMTWEQARLATAPHQMPTIEGIQGPWTHISVNFLLSRPLDYFEIPE